MHRARSRILSAVFLTGYLAFSLAHAEQVKIVTWNVKEVFSEGDAQA